MKIRLVMITPIDEAPFRNIYGPGQCFDVEVKAMDITSDDPNIDTLTLDAEDLEHFRLLGELKNDSTTTE